MRVPIIYIYIYLYESEAVLDDFKPTFRFMITLFKLVDVITLYIVSYLIIPPWRFIPADIPYKIRGNHHWDMNCQKSLRGQ